jgi:hypothetical protein
MNAPNPSLAPAEPMHPAAALLARETHVRRGSVPRHFAGQRVEDGTWVLGHDSVLLIADGNIRLHYRRGDGVTLDAPADADPRDIALWLNGTMYAAVAALNGLMPFHASAVAHRGRVYAFTGPPGAGKSTLAAALGTAGFPLFCDDTLILAIDGDGPITALPGHKRLKLWPEAIDLASAEPREAVASDSPKLFADPAAGTVAKPLPVAELIFLEPAEMTRLITIPAGERLARLQDDHYTAQLFLGDGGLSRAQRFAQLAAIARRMPMHRFRRPFARARFADGVAFIADYIRNQESA